VAKCRGFQEWGVDAAEVAGEDVAYAIETDVPASCAGTSGIYAIAHSDRHGFWNIARVIRGQMRLRSFPLVIQDYVAILDCGHLRRWARRFRWGSPRRVLSSCALLRGLTAHCGFHRFCSNPNALQVAAQSRDPYAGQGAVFIVRVLLKSLTALAVLEFIITKLVISVNNSSAHGKPLKFRSL
jgi:hypothetical protein